MALQPAPVRDVISGRRHLRRCEQLIVCAVLRAVASDWHSMATAAASGDPGPDVPMTASQRRAEIRRRKLMSNSEERMNRIMGIHKPASSGASLVAVEDLRMERVNKPDPPLHPSLTKLGSVLVGGNCTSSGHPCGSGDGMESDTVERTDLTKNSEFKKDSNGLRNRTDVTLDSTPRGLNQYITRFDEAMKLRNQLSSEKPTPENGSGVEEMDSFRIFRLAGSALLALTVRLFVCKYLVTRVNIRLLSAALGLVT
ncbi:unnamed protein product [Ranitomeya imitator]|uniref:Calcium modulating ligand n=1 Tax=Ranitomeya imitator TaxID=111125 RepID=A0ABN9KSM5_9NEOB|nr:unnamed protein product [Ranitomeya imitator]